MMPSSTHGDPQLGLDIHLCVTPAPAPVPLPTPHLSIVFDPMDYIPFTVPVPGFSVMGFDFPGMDLFAPPVEIAGMKRATAGTAGISIHIPPGFPFAPGKWPDLDDEIFMGSSTVQVDGEPLTYTALPVLGCQMIGIPSPQRMKKRPLRICLLPTEVNLAIPKNVLVGGVPTISLMALGFRAGFAALGKALKFAAAKFAPHFKTFRQHLFRNMDPGFLKCTVFRAEPVNIITGEVWLEQSDFTLAGRIPIEWIRSYTSNNHRRGASGVGWETPADGRLEFDPSDASVVFRYPGEGPALFLEQPSAEGDEAAVMELMNGALLSDHGDEWRVRTKRDRIYHFPKVRSQTTLEGLVELPLGQISDPWGNWLKFLYEADRLVAILESAGRYLSFEYTDLGFIKAVALRVPGSEQEYPCLSCEYNPDGDLTVVRDALGNPYLFEYDEHHMTRHVDRNDLSFFYAYDKTGDEWKAIHTWGDGGLYDYRFDYLAELRETRITDSLGQVSTVKCHESGLPVMEIDPLGGRTLYEYDQAGRTTAVVDPANHRTEYRYDERGNQIAEILPDGSTLAVEMDENSKPVAITEPNGAVWHNVWSERGLLESRTSPLGAVTRYRYDPSGLPTTLIDAQEHTTQLEFDRFGALVGLTNALQATTRLQRDEQGNLLALTDVIGRTTGYRYDAKNRLIEVRPPEGGQIRFSYDGEDNLVAHEDKNGNQTGFEYFGQALLTKVHQPNGHSIEYHYDTEERLVGITNQRGERYAIRHDALGRVVEEVDYWGQSTHYRRDLAGYLKQRIDPLGQVTDYACDKLGRILRKSMDHPNRVGARFEERFKYDINGNLTECSNEHGKIQRKFDREGRLSEEKQGAFLIKYEYDRLGRCIRRETGHHAIGYQYDPLGRPVSIQIDDEPPITFERDASGQVLKEQLSPALARYSGFDEAGRLIAQEVKGEADWLFKTTYEYDRVGNLARREDSQFGVDQYRYDPVGQIIEHIDPQGRLNAFLQDPAGDRLRTQVVDMPVQQVVGGADMPGEWYREGVYEGAYYRFDRAGNLTTKRDLSAGSVGGGQSRETQLSWDGNQQLVRSEANGLETSYGYDPLGRRLFKQTGTRKTWFGWDGDTLAAEWTVEVPEKRGKVALLSPISKADLREYLYHPNSFKPLALIEDEASYRYHTEPNGAPTRVMRTDGTLVWAARYGVWGRVEPAANTLDNRLRMQGQYHDEETGLYYNRYRYYDANAGQFVGQDPIRLLGGLNIYQYAPNGLGWVDPLGLQHEGIPYSPSVPHTMPHQRHFLNNIQQRTSPHGDINTIIIRPRSDIAADLVEINAGNAFRVGNDIHINGRVYRSHSDSPRLIPVRGDGFVQASRAQYKAIGLYRTFQDNLERSDEILDKMGISEQDRSFARNLLGL